MECQYRQRQRPKQGNEGAGDETGCNLPRMAMDGWRRERKKKRRRGEKRGNEEKLVMEERDRVCGVEVLVVSSLGSFRYPSMTKLRHLVVSQ